MFRKKRRKALNFQQIIAISYGKKEGLAQLKMLGLHVQVFASLFCYLYRKTNLMTTAFMQVDISVHLSKFGLGPVTDFSRLELLSQQNTLLVDLRKGQCISNVWFKLESCLSFNSYFPHQQIPSLLINSSSFLTDIFDPGHRQMRPLHPASLLSCFCIHLQCFTFTMQRPMVSNANHIYI